MTEPVGKLLARELEARGWTQGQFAEILDRPTQLVNEIVCGKKEITRETARQIGAATGTTAGFWLHQQNLHHLHAQGEDRELQGKLAAIRERACQVVTPPPAPAVTRDELIYVAVEGLTEKFGVYSLHLPSMGPAARVVVDALIAAGHLRPTEGSDTNHA